MASSVVKVKSQSSYRWPILVMCCSMMIANYYCYDIPAALHQPLNDYMGHPSDYESYFSLLYTLYSVPNIILPFFGGYFVDKFGVRMCLIVFACLIAAGQTIFAFGVSVKSWPIMFIGRVVYGFGGESLGVANSAVLSCWFKGKELAFAFGLNLSIARLGSVMNNLVSPALASNVSIEFSLWFGVMLCGLSVLNTLLISSIDKAYDAQVANQGGVAKPLIDADEEDEIDRKNSASNPLKPGDSQGLEDDILDSFGSSPAEALSDDKNEPQPELRDCLKFPEPFWLLAISCVVVYGCVLPFNNIASSLLLERDYFQAPEAGCQLSIPNQCQNDTNVPVNCPLYYSSDTNQPPLPNYLDAGEIDCTQDSYSTGCTEVYCSRLTDAEAEAGTIMSIPYIISATLSPFLGAAVDRYGQRAIVAAICPAALIIVHSLLGLSTVNAVGPLVGQGLAYAGFAAVLWPSVPLVIEDRVVGLGFGLITAIQNGGLAAFPLIIAAIYNDNGNKYIPNVEFFFIALAVLGLIVGIYLNYYDYYHNKVFNSPGVGGASALAEGKFNRHELKFVCSFILIHFLVYTPITFDLHFKFHYIFHIIS